MVATRHHDDGWLAWEADPPLQDDGCPPNFHQLPLADHLAIWRRGVALARRKSLFTALMVSRHATYLYHRYPQERSSGEALMMEQFLEQQAQLQQEWEEELDVDPDLLVRGTHLLALWDGLSLILCRHRSGQHRLDDWTISIDRGRALVDAPLEPLTLEMSLWRIDHGWSHRKNETVSWSIEQKP